MKTDQELKLVLAKMLPEKFTYRGDLIYLLDDNRVGNLIRDTEWLAVCQMIHDKLSLEDKLRTNSALMKPLENEAYCLDKTINASWQLRAQALAKVNWI